MTQSLTELILRDLEKLRSEIEQFDSNEKIWSTPAGVSNSAGNLCLHICGNLQHFIGNALGNNGYVRNRDREFTARDISRSQLLEEISSTSNTIIDVMSALKPSDLSETYPIDVFKKKMSTEWFLIHLFGHLNYHLGQINYLRRLIK